MVIHVYAPGNTSLGSVCCSHSQLRGISLFANVVFSSTKKVSSYRRPHGLDVDGQTVSCILDLWPHREPVVFIGTSCTWQMVGEQERRELSDRYADPVATIAIPSPISGTDKGNIQLTSQPVLSYPRTHVCTYHMHVSTVPSISCSPWACLSRTAHPIPSHNPQTECNTSEWPSATKYR